MRSCRLPRQPRAAATIAETAATIALLMGPNWGRRFGRRQIVVDDAIVIVEAVSHYIERDDRS